MSMREFRDGLVETPEQFQYIARLLQLPMEPVSVNVGSCEIVNASNSFPNPSTRNYLFFDDYLILVFVTLSIFLAYVVMKL